MKKILDIDNGSIEYEIKSSSRARALRLAVYHDGRVIVTTPKGFYESGVEKFILNKLSWLINKITYFKNNPRTILGKGGTRDYKEYKEKARALVHERLLHFNILYNLKWNRISIKNTKSRWGSCSKKGNLNFSYKLALLPQELSDYIIVHELCHLEEMNHSKDFWNLVAKSIPHHKSLRKQLKSIQ